jgi:hypothetical protein
LQRTSTRPLASGPLQKVTTSTTLLVNEVVGTVGVFVLVVIPWVLGGFHPTREDLTWAILLAFASGFLSICALVLSDFDIARFEAAGPSRGEDQ